MQITLKKTISPKHQMFKQFEAQELTLDFVAKSAVSLYDPIIIIQTEEDLTQYNYASVSDWSRLYFVDPKHVNVIGENRYSIQLFCDSLSTFADQLIGIPCIIDRTENAGGSPYIHSEAFVTNCKHKTDIINFPSGLNDTGEFILITAGG